ncbi:hypothetical protein Taro_022150 [Colocasia esculenta]|uniref:Protein Jade-1 n=1 Tax=Colocasia esculenta TaxID=4460 RepID=A0A843VAF8_COLES|nr:hypothetical protein [Colocasia esculenta]
MANSFHGLPPSKRFKLLQQRESRVPCGLPPAACLPAKKRIETHRRGGLPPPLPPPATSCCLPAKKRVWAPHPVLGIEEYGSEGDEAVAEEIKLWSSTEPECGEVTIPEAEAVRPREKLEAEEEPEEAEKAAVAEEEDDGIVCSVCQSTDAHPTDPIVLCDGCDLMVHASCYGNPLIKSIPEGDWFCVRCEKKGAAQKKGPDCCLCLGKGGATKPTTDGRWAHVLCALLVPEVFFHDPEGREGVDLSRVPARRWAGACCVCGSDSGCVVDCSEPKCGLAFHVSCGLDADFCVEYREDKGGGIVVGFCEDHTRLWKKQQTTGKFKFVPREKK